ncbi:MAG: baseplate J/gp47 family protein [Methylococcaceae bacterium]
MTADKCEPNIDTLRLIHQGTSQDQRVSAQLKPDYVKVDERKIENDVVFAKAYSSYLKFYGSNNTATGDWEVFFSRDVSVQLAMAAIQDIEYYKINVKESFDFLNNREHKDSELELKNQLGCLFSSIGTLAKQLDDLKESLPIEIPLKHTIQNLIQNQLASGFRQLILHYRDGLTPNPPAPPNAPYLNDVKPKFDIMGAMATFKEVRDQGLSKDWITEDKTSNWADYLKNLNDSIKYPATKIYGGGNTIFERLNHIATHNLFTAIFDQFLKVFARVVIDAKAELEKTFGDWNKHEPHYALFLAFLKLFDYARMETNTLTQRHLDFYYRDILRLKEKPAEPSHVHLLIELAKHVDAHEIKKDELFKAGKDDLGVEVFFANERDFVANQAKVTELKTLYRHKYDPKKPNDLDNRLFASPKADSADGLGAKLTTVDQSWHPFSNKVYENGKLTQINMPQAEVGFAIASHYLWLAEGTRIITVDFTIDGATDSNLNGSDDVICLVTTEKEWFPAKVTTFKLSSNKSQLQLIINLDGADPAITPYSAKSHGYQFETDLPMLLVKLAHSDKANFIYASLEAMTVQKIAITADVIGLKTLAVSNDFGSVDTSKPFQPFGALPFANSALIIGSKEVFQKVLASVTVNVKWQNPPKPYKKTVNVNFKYLQNSAWSLPINTYGIKKLPKSNGQVIFDLNFSTLDSEKLSVNIPDFSDSEFYNTNTRHGFIRLEIDTDFGQSQYEQELFNYIAKTLNIESNITNIINKVDTVKNSLNGVKAVSDVSATKATIAQAISNSEVIKSDLKNVKDTATEKKPTPPVGPFVAELTLDYTTAKQVTQLNSDELTFKKRPAKFFHVTPFGQCEQHGLLNALKKVFLVPQFDNAEFYIGITGLKPPQNLALLFQVADGTADPLLTHPSIQWSYLGNNEWLEFGQYDVQDNTNGLINSGIITFAMPDTATATNTLLPAGQHWLKAAVTEKSEAVCKLLAVSAQSLKVTFDNQNNDPAFLANTLAAETINKLKQPDAAVKKVSQPFANFGGRAAEQASTFYTRVSERLRHKDRTITLWDYEHLILEAFPQIYRVKCLNHTQYVPDETGQGIYDELAPGHITIVTLPNQQYHNLHNPLRPYTSLGVLAEIEAFLQKKLSCFVKLYVKNPQFEEVRVGFKVKFYEGFDKSFYTKTLDTAITHFLSPWAFSDGGNPTFGGKVYLSTLLNFVEEQPYVDYVTDFSFIKSETDRSGVLAVSEIEGSKAISILVSANQHKIEDALNSDQTIDSGEPCGCPS